MGLLDGNLDPQTAGALALAGGLLSPGSFGQGLSRGIAGQQAVMTNAQEMELRKQQMEQQKQAQMIAALNFEQSRAGFNVGLQALNRQPLPPVNMSVLSGNSALNGAPSLGAGPIQAPSQAPAQGQQTAQGPQAPQGGPQAPPQSGGIDFGSLGVDPTAAGLTFSGNPAMEKLGAMIQKQREPLINRGFGINKWNPVTQKYELDEGSAEGIQRVENIKADTAAAHDMVKLENPDGSSRYVTKAQQIAEAAGVPAPSAPSLRATDLRSSLTAPDAKFDSPALKARLFAAAGIPAPQSTLMSGQTTLGKELQQERGKQAGEQEAKINADAASAFSKIAQNNKMIELLPQVLMGPLAKQVTTLKQLGQSLGIDVGDPSNNQEFEKYAIKGALEGAKQIYGARLTNQDVMQQIASNPGTSMGEKAVYELIKYDNIVQQRHLDKQQAYFTDDGPKNTFDMRFNRDHPFMGITAPAPGQTAEKSAPGAVLAPKSLPMKSSRLKPNGRGGFDYVPE